MSEQKSGGKSPTAPVKSASPVLPTKELAAMGSWFKEFTVTFPWVAGYILFVSAVSGYGYLTGNAVGARSLVVFVASLITTIAIAISIYAFSRLMDIRRAESERLGIVFTWRAEKAKKDARWAKVEEYIASAHPSDWKIAILEADNILDEIVKRMGYPGETLGERMKHIEASDFPMLDEAWEVHKIRNQIAHKGTDYPLTRTEAENVIDVYHRLFKELGYL
jgi:hypothetical protein